MRMFLYVLLIGLVFVAPVENYKIAKLEPVETVAVYLEDGQVVLETDTQRQGRGDTAASAVEALKKGSSMELYLDTVRYLLVAPGAEGQAEELEPLLKTSVRVGKYNGGEVKEAAKYAQTHQEMGKFRQWKNTYK